MKSYYSIANNERLRKFEEEMLACPLGNFLKRRPRRQDDDDNNDEKHKEE